MNETHPFSAHLSKHRIEALIDGIFAVVMTLLVIDLRLPEHAHNLDDAALRNLLAACVRSACLMLITLLTIPLAAVMPGKSNAAFGLMFFIRPAGEFIARRLSASSKPAAKEEEEVAASEPAA